MWTLGLKKSRGKFLTMKNLVEKVPTNLEDGSKWWSLRNRWKMKINESPKHFFFLCHSLYHPVSNYQICTKFLFWCHKSKREGDMLFLLFLFCDNKKKKFRIWCLVFSHRLVQWKKHLFSLERIQNWGHCELFGVHIRWVMDIFVAGNFSILFVCRPVCLPVHSGFFFILINNL